MSKLRSFIFFFSIFCTSIRSQCPDQWIPSSVQANKCYLVVINATEWFLGDYNCHQQAHGSILTTVASAFEVNNINAILSNRTDVVSGDLFWIGANDFSDPFNGKFEWADGQTFSYANWDSAQPDLDYECVAMVAISGKWRTTQCRTHCNYICEYYIPTSGSSSTTASLRVK